MPVPMMVPPPNLPAPGLGLTGAAAGTAAAAAGGGRDSALVFASGFPLRAGALSGNGMRGACPGVISIVPLNLRAAFWRSASPVPQPAHVAASGATGFPQLGQKAIALHSLPDPQLDRS
jgi:hypothetical protein